MLLKNLRNKIFLLSMVCLILACKSDNNFVKTDSTTFKIQDETYRYIGCNYWYGGYLGASDPARLQKELDFLAKQNVNNLRVFLCGEGDSTYPFRIHPALQEKPGVYNEDLLKGFDYFLNEAAKRKMKIVFVLNNNWEWSGGFGQYLEWVGKKNPPLPKTQLWDWENYCLYISQFYSCDSCLVLNKKWIQKVVGRTNTVNGKKYFEDPCIMSWELANEPRPMKESAIEDYKNWITASASQIKSIDKNHLITIGTEGVISTFYQEELYSVIHQDKNIDYATLHLWPKTWQWYNGNHKHAVSDTTLEKTKKYIIQHARIAKALNKPLVIEEFGLHRDYNSFSPDSTVVNRDKYYQFVFEIGQAHDISGYNFWGFAGLPENFNSAGFMQKGMSYSADPPQEEQGLYSVFMQDSSTWKCIQDYQDAGE